VHVSANTLDDLLLTVFKRIIRSGERVKATKGWNAELTAVVLELTNPRARLSRTETKGTAFSCLGETLWYLAKSNKLKFIKYYLNNYDQFAERDGTVHGAYGPRLFSMRGQVDQVKTVIELLRKKPSSRQAVIQLFNAEDILKDYNDVPCTCTLQFFVRKKLLNAVSHMRSNDAFLGLPHDVFAFTFIQELVARSLKLDVGSYKHMAGSLHIYDCDREKVKLFIKEGYQARISMPAMPLGNPWPQLAKLIKVESEIREGQHINIQQYSMSGYWSDLMRLLQVFAMNKRRQPVSVVRTRMVSPVYDTYIERAARNIARKKAGRRASKR
jgi:thymidylate synthase